MKKRLLLFYLLVIAQFAFGQSPTPILHFPFDGSLTDAVGNYTFIANTGVTTNYVTDRFGNVGKAYSTPVDVNQKLEVEIPALLPQGNDERTISFWVKMKANNHWLNLVTYGEANGYNHFGVGTEVNHMMIGSSTITNVFPEMPNQEHAQWGNLVITYSQAEGTKAYYNGREVFESSTINWNTVGDMLYLNFPRNWFPYENDFTLTYDDLKIYDVALTETQVIESLIEDSTLDINDLVGYFQFENDLNNSINPNISFEGTGTFVPGHTGGSTAIEFSPAYNQFHKTNNLNNISDDNITISFWRKRSVAPQQPHETDIELFGSLFFREDANNLVMGILSGSGAGSYAQSVMPKSAYNVWEHYTVVFKVVSNHRHLYMYRNGVLRGWITLGNNTPMLKFTDLVTIGIGTDTDGNIYPSKKANNLQMDNLFIFNRALSEMEIMGLAFQEPDGNTGFYTITANANPSYGGTIIGDGVYVEGSTVTLTASGNSSFDFVKWTENGSEVSTDATYTFTATGDRELVAEFEGNALYVHIPDANFKSYLLTHFDLDNDGEISYSEAAAVTGGINVPSLNISDLTGIEAFVNLTDLVANNNQIVEVDLSQNTLLWRVNLRNNQLESLDLSANTNLINIYLNNNNLSYLNVKNGNNANITLFIVNSNIYLECIEVDDPAYSSANWTGPTYLIDYWITYRTICSKYDITASVSPSLAGTVSGTGNVYGGTTVTVTATPTIAFDFVRWTLDGVEVSTDNPYSFTLTEDTHLVAEFESNGLYVYIPDQSFKSYLLSQPTINTTSDSEISFAEAEAFTGAINCGNSGISDLTGIEAFINLTSLSCSLNNLTSVDLSANTELTYLNIRSNQLTALDISNNSKITQLDARYNEIASIDLGASPLIEWIELEDNELTSIDLSTASELKSVDVNNNNLTSLDTSNNPELIQIQCEHNQISSLDVSQNPLLAHLWIQHNQMTELDLRNGTNSTNLGQIKAGYNNLSCVQVDNEVYSTANWTGTPAGAYSIEFDAGVTFSEFCYDDCTINHRRSLGTGSAGNLQVRTMAADFVITNPYMKLEELQFHLEYSQPTDAEIAIFTDNNGQPGTMIHGPIQVSPVSEIYDSNPVSSYKVIFDIASENIILSGNGTKYWISIVTPNQHNAWRPAQVVSHNTNMHYTTDNYQTWVEWAHFDVAFNILGDCNVTVSTYDIVATANPTNGGTITGAGSYSQGTTVNLEATPNTGYNFVRWTENGTEVSTSAAYSFTANANRTLVAEFDLIAVPQYTITATASPSAGGSVTGAGTYDQGDTVNMTATANAGYEFVSWRENGYQVSTDANYSFTASADRTLVAEFAIKSYTIAATAIPSAGGTIFGVGNGNFTHGASVSLTASPHSGYIFVRWTENGMQVSTDANYSFTADADRTLVAEFELKAYAITASANPSTGGSITGAGTFDHGDSVSLTATANAGYDFVRWTENGTQVSTSATYSFTANANRTLVAEFAIKSYIIAATSSPVNGGTITGTGDYNHGATVSLTATASVGPYAGYEFVRWTENGTEVSTSATYTFTANANRTLVAEFVEITYNINASANPSAGGTITGAGSHNHGATVSLTATANAGYSFVRWTENGSHVTYSATYTFAAHANRTLVAEFDLISVPQYTITATASPSAGGSVTGAGTYDQGDTVNMNATANAGYEFVRWTENGTEVSTSAAYSFTANANRTLVAEFDLIAVPQYTITATANPSAGGSVTGAGTYDQGDTVTVTATANAGYEFVRWTENGTEVSTSAAYSFTATANRTLVAEFNLIPVPQYTITATANPSAGGSVTGAGTYDQGDTVNMNATANAGYEFVRWTENGTEVSTSAAYSFTANANRTLVAEFEVISVPQYTITATANPSAGGSVTGAGTYDQGDTVNMNATANAGYEFVRWTENGTEVSTSAAYSFTANANRTLVAEFDLIPVPQYTITATANPSAGGSVTGAGTYDQGDTVTVTATANAGYEFVRWTENGTEVSTSAAYSFTATANRTLVAEFNLIPVPQYTITATANPSAGGSVTGAGTYDQGDTVNMNATANAGYEFVRWTENGTEVSTSAAYSFTASANRTLVAEFDLIPIPQYTITATANPSVGGTVSGAGTYDQGDTVNMIATANAGYEFVRWTENGTEVSTDAAYSFTATANRTLVAEFDLIPIPQYTISATANPSAGGTVTGAGTYNQGDTVNMTATANAGYEFVRWTENGTEVSVDAVYSFTVSIDRTLVAEFDLILGITDINIPTIEVYPNPVYTVLNINVKSKTSVKIVNMLGISIETYHLKKGNNIIDMRHLTNGIYFLRTDKGATIKVIKK